VIVKFFKLPIIFGVIEVAGILPIPSKSFSHISLDIYKLSVGNA
jgi:hypothetical protein